MLTETDLSFSGTEIEAKAFCGREDITSVKIPVGIERVGKGAFAGCVSLKSVEFPGTVKFIDEGAFADCRALESVRFEEGIEHIAREAFARCEVLEEVEFPKSIRVLEEDAFLDCRNLSTVNFKRELECFRLMSRAFGGCNCFEWCGGVRNGVHWDGIRFRTYRIPKDSFLSDIPLDCDE